MVAKRIQQAYVGTELKSVPGWEEKDILKRKSLLSIRRMGNQRLADGKIPHTLNNSSNATEMAPGESSRKK